MGVNTMELTVTLDIRLDYQGSECRWKRNCPRQEQGGTLQLSELGERRKQLRRLIAIDHSRQRKISKVCFLGI